MKQIAVVSGKGGTGKTTLVGSLSVLFKNHVMADCDVDAPNLHLLMEPQLLESHEFYGSKKAVIGDRCISCGLCKDTCRFDAIKAGGPFEVDPYACEGCGACTLVCPAGAISLEPAKAGDYFLSRAGNFPLSHALLQPGEETSGGLIAEVRKLALKEAEHQERDFIIIDGSPGIGCSASSSITGVNHVIIVTEPTMSGIHDLERIVETVRYFRREFSVIINKCDINLIKSQEIEDWCSKKDIEILGRIPFDQVVREAAIKAQPIVDYPESKASISIREIFYRLKEKF